MKSVKSQKQKLKRSVSLIFHKLVSSTSDSLFSSPIQLKNNSSAFTWERCSYHVPNLHVLFFKQIKLSVSSGETLVGRREKWSFDEFNGGMQELRNETESWFEQKCQSIFVLVRFLLMIFNSICNFSGCRFNSLIKKKKKKK